jgi:hypothetical protein
MRMSPSGKVPWPVAGRTSQARTGSAAVEAEAQIVDPGVGVLQADEVAGVVMGVDVDVVEPVSVRVSTADQASGTSIRTETRPGQKVLMR